MMKSNNLFKRILVLFFLFGLAQAQDQLSPIGSNSSLFQQAQKATTFYQNIIIESDTLNLPFLDEFSSNTLRPIDFTSFITDTVDFATGDCITSGDFITQTDTFSLVATYTYFFDTTNDVIDSVINQAINFTSYDGLNCFPTPSAFNSYWPMAYTYQFDTATGNKLDSTLLLANDTILTYTSIYFAQQPTTSNWVDNYAFINTTFPINPPTIGVATLDGLNEFGRPYNNSVINPVGEADKLTSKPIDLSGLHNDSAVFISFFVQAKGNGDFPNTEDSLVLEFKNEYEDQWIKVWGINIDNIPVDTFKQFYVAVRDTNLVTGPRYFYEDFQFRFRNIASLSGNNDHWHLDYIRLDKNRQFVEQDTVIRDVAFMYDFPGIFENYTQLPWSQYQAGADQFIDSLAIPIRDNGQVNGVSAGSFPIEILITDSLDSDTIFELTGQNFNATSVIKPVELSPVLTFNQPIFDADSICVNSLMYMGPTSRNLLFSNDTIRNQVCLDKVMAYDDGSAEKAYGLSGSPGEIKKFAYKFHVAHPDTLAAIQIHFSNIDEDVSDLIFNLMVWDSIELGIPLPFENVIGEINNVKPSYINEYNGFVTFAFDTPILVTDTFYIGFSQTESRNLQIGFDKNSTRGKENMFVFANSVWNPTSLLEDGSPMIRALLDAEFDFNPGTPIRQVYNIDNQFSIYPNPSAAIFNIDVGEYNDDFTIRVFDVSGQLILSTTNQSQIDLSSFNTGMYLVQIQTKEFLVAKKIIKR